MELKFSDLRSVVTIVVTLVLHACAIIWWGSSLNSKVDENRRSIDALTEQAYFTRQAEQDLRLRDQMIETMRGRMETMEANYKDAMADVKNSVNRIELKLDRYIFKGRMNVFNRDE